MVKRIWMSPREYNLVASKSVIPCIDLVILRRNDEISETLLLKRKIGYEKGKWCIIGGRQYREEVAIQTIERQACELGVMVEVISPFEPNFPAWINDNPQQDKTKHSCSMTYPVRIVSGELRNSGEEYSSHEWFSINEIPDMAYDHRFQVLKTIEQLRKFNTLNEI